MSVVCRRGGVLVHDFLLFFWPFPRPFPLFLLSLAISRPSVCHVFTSIVQARCFVLVGRISNHAEHAHTSSSGSDA